MSLKDDYLVNKNVKTTEAGKERGPFWINKEVETHTYTYILFQKVLSILTCQGYLWYS